MTTFVLVHGAWHDSRTWDAVVLLLEAAGHRAIAVSLPGADASAPVPASYRHRPLDPAAFGSEPSPVAGVTHAERVAAVTAVVRAAGEPVVLVGHSLGGITVSAVAEEVPQLLRAVVFLSAFMLAPGIPAIAMIQHESMSDALVPGLFLADPEQVGALRLDPLSDDEGYRANLHAAFFGDVPTEQFLEFRHTLHPDEPVSVALVPSAVTAERFGTVTRHYIGCDADRAVTPAGQAVMIGATDAAVGGATTVHTLASSHSPFLSQPRELAGLLEELAG